MTSRRWMTGILGLGFAMLAGLAASASAVTTLLSDALDMGEGEVRSYVELAADGRPTAIGVVMSERALIGLPPLKNATSRCFDLNDNGRIDGAGECEGDLELAMDLPHVARERADIPFRWVGVNWNAEGHPPGAWSVPHFDFHFYIASRDEVAAIRVGGCTFFINCDDRKIALEPVPDRYMSPDHADVEATVSQMGNHLIDLRTPELADPPERAFTHTWIFGAYGGRITFYEPMITLAYLLSRPDHCTPIRQPEAWVQSGYYPTEYCIRYHQRRGVYTVSLEGLVLRAAE